MQTLVREITFYFLFDLPSQWGLTRKEKKSQVVNVPKL